MACPLYEKAVSSMLASSGGELGLLSISLGFLDSSRVSTHDQNLDLQQDALKKAGCEKLFVDEPSGAKAARPGLQQAMDSLREGDVLVVWRLDRLGRSLRNLLELVEKLKERKVGFRSIQESMVTSTCGGDLIFQVFGALAEFSATSFGTEPTRGWPQQEPGEGR